MTGTEDQLWLIRGSYGRDNVHRSATLHRLSSLRCCLPRMRYTQRLFDDLCRLHRSRLKRPRRCRPSACIATNRPARLFVRRCDQGVRRWRGDVGTKAALSRLPQLRQCLSLRRAKVQHTDAPSDEVRHVLRPFIGRLETDVRQCLSDRCDLFRKDMNRLFRCDARNP